MCSQDRSDSTISSIQSNVSSERNLSYLQHEAAPQDCLTSGLNVSYTLQSGTKEHQQEEVEMGEIEGPVLKALTSFMYGSLKGVSQDLALPLFLAADAHQGSFHISA